MRSKYFASSNSAPSPPNAPEADGTPPGTRRVVSRFFLAKNSPLVSESESPSGCLATTCPQCQGNLKERIGRWGVFMGCENFPRCRFTQNLSRRSRSSRHLHVTVEMETPDTVRVYSLTDQQESFDLVRDLLANTDLTPLHTEPRHDHATGHTFLSSSTA
eukprot:2954869-Pyramimonas_sp.AAC.1